MIVIVEGIDKAGKSTVITDISSVILPNALIWKLFNKPKNKQRDEVNKVYHAYTELLYQASSSHKKVPIIFDRCYPSELVYSIKRGYDAMFDLRWWELDKTLKDNVVVVYCELPGDQAEAILKERFEQSGETDLKLSEIPKILERYNHFISKTQVPFIRLNTAKSREENLIELMQFLKKYEHQ